MFSALVLDLLHSHQQFLAASLARRALDSFQMGPGWAEPGSLIFSEQAFSLQIQ